MTLSLIMMIIELILKLPEIIKVIGEIIARFRQMDRPAAAEARQRLKPILKRHLKREEKHFASCESDLMDFLKSLG